MIDCNDPTTKGLRLLPSEGRLHGLPSPRLERCLFRIALAGRGTENPGDGCRGSCWRDHQRGIWTQAAMGGWPGDRQDRQALEHAHGQDAENPLLAHQGRAGNRGQLPWPPGLGRRGRCGGSLGHRLGHGKDVLRGHASASPHWPSTRMTASRIGKCRRHGASLGRAERQQGR